MGNKGDAITTLSIKELLNGIDNYVIPIYQRNFAWGESEITQLIQDIIDYLPVNKAAPKNYYLGTLIVFERKDGSNIIFETIDGQQRLTTLSLLTSVIRNKYETEDVSWFNRMNLDFANRKISTETLDAVFADYFSNNIEYTGSIKNGYELTEKLLKIKLSENNVKIGPFAEFLFKSVKILRVPVPYDTDLNHYFEIMNSRGEQLEKHEILKATFLEVLDLLDEPEKQTASQCFHLIWEACSNMEKYVQYGFTVDQRNAIFGLNDWNWFTSADFYELSEKLKPTFRSGVHTTNKLTISEIIEGKRIKVELHDKDENPDRFNSVINFPNFLLHVLRVQTKKDIPLDDKRLIKTFEDEIKNAKDKVEFTKSFAFHLLKCKFLFDKYIIKREFISGTDRWSLKRLKWYPDNKVSYVNTFGDGDNNDVDDNRKILMLLSMFHVSTPTLVYKHWLNAALHYLNQQNEVESSSYIDCLESVAKAFVFDRFLSLKEPKEYYDIIYHNTHVANRTIKDLDLSKLRFGNISNNLVFNYLDYLLWKYDDDKTPLIKFYEFSFRSSVEHYYPQDPMQGFPKLDDDHLHSFGNLCLISHSKNSRLSNFPPTAKKQYYAQNNIDSIKQNIMMTEYDSDNWGITSIDDHNNKMIEILTSDLNSHAKISADVKTSSNNISPKALRWFNEYQLNNKPLLARALLCFGRIDNYWGSTSGGEKWNLYQWDLIRKSDAFKLFEKFIETNNPSSLKEIIDHQIKHNKDLRKDSYRYIFVTKPEILEYCTEGNYGWINDGKKILLLKGDKAGSNITRELYTFLLDNFISSKFNIESGFDIEDIEISLSYDPDDDRIYLNDYDENSNASLHIWYDEAGKIKGDITTYHLKGNSKFAEKLNELGWNYNDEKRMVRNNKTTFIKLDDDYVDNYERLQDEFLRLIKNGLNIY